MAYTNPRFILSFLLTIGLFVFFVTPTAVFAQDSEATAQKSEEETIKALNKDIEAQVKQAAEERKEAAEETYGLMTALVLDANEKEQKHFLMTYTNYNFIQTVKVVQTDVGKAIDKCGENNPDMEKALDERFAVWNKAVNPLLKEAQANLDNMIIAQDYASKDKIEEIFTSVERTRDLTNNQIEKIPVTTPEACTYLIEKLDETQDQMVSLLRSTLVTVPQAFSATLAEEPAEASEEAKEE